MMHCLSVAWKGAVLLVGAVPPLTAQQVRELANGMQVVVVENHLAPVATVLVAVRGGAAVQRRTERGLAHIFEHMLFRAYGDGHQTTFGGDAAGLNAAYNGTTHDEVVDYFLLLPSEHAIEGVGLMGRLLTHPQFRPADLEAERGVVLDELERGQSDPERSLARQVSRQLWGAAWHRRDVAGDSLSLMGIGATRLLEEYTQYYVPGNAALIVTGDVSPDEVFQAAERDFGEWKTHSGRSTDRQLVPLTPLGESRAVIVVRDLSDVTIHIEMQGPGVRDDPDATYAADALFEIVNDADSHFQRQLVGRGLFQSLSGSYRTLGERGPITIAGKTTPGRATDALLALLTQIDSLGFLVEVDAEDLLIATRRREVDAAIEREAASTLAPSLASSWAASGIDYYVTYKDRMKALTLDDLRRFATRYLVGQPRVLGLMGPNDAMVHLAEWLRAAQGRGP